MKNPPNFVGYVVMVRDSKEQPFSPYWVHGTWVLRTARLYRTKAVAAQAKSHAIKFFGRGNAYVQQYGPIS